MIKKLFALLMIVGGVILMSSCSDSVSFDPINTVIYLEAGFENGNGSEEQPFGDILDAVAKAKELGIAGAESITLNFGAGDYSLTETLVLSSADFGGASLEMICEEEGKAIVGAWLPVTGFSETEVNGVKAWVADMPILNGETVYSHQFFSADYKRLQRPRYPEEGYLVVESLVNENGDIVSTETCPDRNAEGFDRNAFVFNENEILDNITRVSDVQVYMFQYWNTQRRTLRNIDYDKNIITLNGTGQNFIEYDKLGARYYLDNVFEALDTAGEVYNDRENGKLYYIPYSDDNIADFKIFASTIETLLIIDGMNGSPEENSLTVKNLGFVGSDWKMEDKYPGQAESMISASIQLMNSSYILFENCTFDHIGTYAVEVKTFVNNVTFSRCSVSDVGAGGFRISGENIVPVTDKVPYNITVSDCTINGYGKVFGGAIGILLQFAHDCTISHNEIFDGYYTGISVGMVWGYGDNATSNILIEKNHVYNIGQKVLSDMGGIYLLGVQPGTKVCGNLIHDVNSYSGGVGTACAIYTDEGSSDMLIENNIAYNTNDMIFYQHYGANNTVRNNIFAFGAHGVVFGRREEDHVTFSLERNILVNDDNSIYWSDSYSSFIDDSNLMYDYTMKGSVLSLDKLKSQMSPPALEYAMSTNFNKFIKKGLYKNAVVSDPLFADPFNGDFTLPENSPAWDIGFEAIDLSDIGPRN